MDNEAKQPDEKEIFFAAMEIQDSSLRKEFLEDACHGDELLKTRLEALLSAHIEKQDSLDLSLKVVLPTYITPTISESVGTQIGPYKLMELIGEGGFGLVFVAEQHEPVRRKVALKIIKPGMDSQEVVARFAAERQALALMDHPNIAKVLDAGSTESGRPYFVMELVRGLPITEYCNSFQLSTRERLELFVSVCRAVHHAHQKGVIHRDIKPSNVMVTQHDGSPVVKVIDFGVAKALYQPLTEHTIYTRFAQIIGTPMYMSPEQAGISSLDVDTRSDVYSLGVLLYELLTGSTPFDRSRFCKAAYDEFLKILRDEEPPKPSTRISQSKDSIAMLAAQRRSEPASLSKLVAGELDWITMKAIEKERSRRYDSAAGFAADIERFLRDEPVEAGPPSVSYRLKKLARKYRGFVMTVVSFMMLMILGIICSSWFAIRESHARAFAVKNEQLAKQEQTRAEEQRIIAENARKNAAHQAGLAESEKLRAEAETRSAQTARASEAEARRNSDLAAQREAAAAEAAIAEKDRAERLLIKSEWALYGRQIAETQRELEKLNSLEAWTILQSTRHDMRGWEYRHMKSLFQGSREIVTRSGNTPQSVGISADGTRLAICTYVRTPKGNTQVLLFSTESAKLLKTINWSSERHPGVFPKLRFSPDGNRLILVVASPRSSGRELGGNQMDLVYVWNTATGEPVSEFFGKHGSVSDDNQYLALANPTDPEQTNRSKMSVKELGTGNPVATISISTQVPISEIRWSQLGTRVAVCQQDGAISVWEIPSGRQLTNAVISNESKTRDCLLNSTGTRIAVRNAEGNVKMLSIPQATPVLEFKQNVSRGELMKFSDDGKLFAVCTDQLIKVWDAETGKELSSYNPSVSPLSPASLHFANQSAWIVIIGKYGTTQVVDPVQGKVISRFENIAGRFTPLGTQNRLIAVHVSRGSFRLCDVETMKERGVFNEGSSPVVNVTPHPDGKQFAVGLEDGTVKLWNTTDRPKVVFQLDGLTNRFICADGKRAVSCDRNGVAQIWSFADSKALPIQIERNADAIPSHVVRISPDGRYLLAQNASSSLKCEIGPNGELLNVIRVSDDIYHDVGLEITPNSEQAILSYRGVLRIRDLKAFKESGVSVLGGGASTIALSPSGQMLIVGGRDGRVLVQNPFPLKGQGTNLSTLAPKALVGHKDAIVGLYVTPDESHLVSVSSDRSLRVWDLTSLTLKKTIDLSEVPLCLTGNPKGTEFSVGDLDGNVRAFSSITFKELRHIKKFSHAVTCLAYDPGGTKLVCGLSEGGLNVIDAQTSMEVSEFRGHTGRVNSVVFHPTRSLIASGGQDGTIRMWNVTSGASIASISTLEKPLAISPLALAIFSPDRRRLVATPRRGFIRVWEPASGKQIAILEHSLSHHNAMAVSPDSQKIAALSDHGIAVWSLETGKIQVRCEHPQDFHRNVVVPTLRSLCFDSKGKVIAAIDDNHRLRIWDANTGKVLSPHQADQQLPTVARKAIFSTDAEQILTEDIFSFLRLQTLGKSKSIVEFTGHGAPTTSLAFQRDGQRMASCGLDGTMRVWETGSGQEVYSLRTPRTVPEVAGFDPQDETLTVVSDEYALQMQTSPPETLQTADFLPQHEVQFEKRGRWAAVMEPFQISLWDTKSGAFLRGLSGSDANCRWLTLDPQGKWVCASRNGIVHFWDALTGKPVDLLKDQARAILFSPDGQHLLYNTSQNGSWKLRNLKDGTEGRPLSTPPTWHPLRLSQDGRLVLAATESTRQLWDLESGAQDARFPSNLTIHELSLDGTLAIAIRQHSIRNNPGRESETPATSLVLYDLRSHTELAELPSPVPANFEARISQDNSIVYLAARGDEKLSWYHGKTGRLIHAVRMSRFGRIAFDSSNRLLAIGDTSQLRLIDVKTGSELAILSGSTIPVERLAFSEDGHLIFGSDGIHPQTLDLSTVPELANFPMFQNEERNQ